MMVAGVHGGSGLFDEVDSLFMRRADPSAAYGVLEQYRMIYRQQPDNGDAAWRVAMACYFYAFNHMQIQPSSERKKLYAEGRDAGLRAVALMPDSAAANFWTAVTMALYAEETGRIKMLFTLHDIRQYLTRCLELDPGYAYGGAHRILGKIDESLPALLGGDVKRARWHYEQAIALAPDEPTNYLFLAQLMISAFKDIPVAREIVLKGLALPAHDASRFEAIDARKELFSFYENKLKQ